MDVDKLFPSKYLKAADLRGRSCQVTILRIAVEKMWGGVDKAIAHFHGKSKGMILNRTQAIAIAEIAGSRQTEQWSGTSIILTPSTTKDAKGATVQTILIQAPPRKADPAPAAPAAQPATSSSSSSTAARPDEFDSGPPPAITAADIRF